MAQLRQLELNGNQIGDKGLEALSGALATGALAQCTTLVLGGNKIGDKGIEALSEALATGAMPQLKELYLLQNQIGDTGVTALANACATGAMAHLRVSWHPTALSSGPGTWHAHSSDPDVLLDVQYAGALAQQQPDW